MVQLLQKQFPTIPYTNAVLRSIKDFAQVVMLRSEGTNYPDFAKLSVLKDLTLDLGRLVSAEFVSDVCLLIVKSGEQVKLNATDNRLILCLENSSVFSREDVRFTPDTGDLMWTNEEIEVINASGHLSILLVIDFREFLL